MVLPSGINKATGLAASLKELGLSPRESRRVVLDAVRKRYTAPADAPDDK